MMDPLTSVSYPRHRRILFHEWNFNIPLGLRVCSYKSQTKQKSDSRKDLHGRYEIRTGQFV